MHIPNHRAWTGTVLAMAGVASSWELTESLGQHPIAPCTDLKASAMAKDVITPQPEDELHRLVQNKFVKRMPKIVDPGIAAHSKPWAMIKSKWDGDYNQMDIQSIIPDSCVPVVKSATSIAFGIWCRQAGGCEVSKQLTTSKSYENTVGAKIGITETAGVDVEIFKAEVSISAETSWEKKFVHGSSSTDTYTFKLAQNESCVPSMVHVEFECKANPIAYYWDNYARYGVGLRPEWNINRGGGPYRGGQWCTEFFAEKDTTLSQSWEPFLAGDWGRGYGWTGDPTYWRTSKQHITTQDLIIRRKDGDAGDVNTLIICKPAHTANALSTRVPYDLGNDVLPGYIGCI